MRKNISHRLFLFVQISRDPQASPDPSFKLMTLYLIGLINENLICFV